MKLRNALAAARAGARAEATHRAQLHGVCVASYSGLRKWTAKHEAENHAFPPKAAKI